MSYFPHPREGGVHREHPGGGRGRQVAAWVLELSELTASWPGPAVGASPGLSFLRGWAGGLKALRGEGVHEASGAGELLGLHSSPPPPEPWRGLCAPWNDQCPSARLVRAPSGAGESWAA